MDRDQHRPCRKACIPAVNIFLFQHLPESERHSILVGVRAADDLCKDKVQPRRHKRGQHRVDDDRLAERQRDLGKDLPSRTAVQDRRLVHLVRDRVKKSLRDLEAEPRAARITEDQRHPDQIALGQPDRLQDKIHGDHGHEAREQSE